LLTPCIDYLYPLSKESCGINSYTHFKDEKFKDDIEEIRQLVLSPRANEWQRCIGSFCLIQDSLVYQTYSENNASVLSLEAKIVSKPKEVVGPEVTVVQLVIFLCSGTR
jgi:hypothetical protein